MNHGPYNGDKPMGHGPYNGVGLWVKECTMVDDPWVMGRTMVDDPWVMGRTMEISPWVMDRAMGWVHGSWTIQWQITHRLWTVQ